MLPAGGAGETPAIPGWYIQRMKISQRIEQILTDFGFTIHSFTIYKGGCTICLKR